jgi:lipopolysaccharide heptosyltransferase II
MKNKTINKILCIKPRGIGDVVGATIVIDNLKAFYPQAEIHFLTEDFASEIVANHPGVHKVLTFHRSDSLLSILRKVHPEKYDLVLDLYSNPRTALVTLFSFVKRRVGYPRNWRTIAYNVKSKMGAPYDHFAEHNLHQLDAIDVPIVSKNMQCFTSQECIAKAEKFIRANNPMNKTIIGILPTGGWSSKRCEAQKWIEFIGSIKSQFDVRFLIIRGPAEIEDAQQIFSATSDCSILAPMGSLSDVMGLLKQCRAVVATDSGIMHVSAGLGLPTIGLFGQSAPRNFAPYNEQSVSIVNSSLDCLECGHRDCPRGHECMLQLDPELIVSALRKILS